MKLKAHQKKWEIMFKNVRLTKDNVITVNNQLPEALVTKLLMPAKKALKDEKDGLCVAFLIKPRRGTTSVQFHLSATGKRKPSAEETEAKILEFALVCSCVLDGYLAARNSGIDRRRRASYVDKHLFTRGELAEIYN